MRKQILLVLICLFSGLLYAGESDLDTAYKYKFSQERETLKEAKFSIINGNTDHARLLLEREFFESKMNQLIKRRYLGMIYFLEERFAKSYNQVNYVELNLGQNFAQICHLLVLNKILTNNNVQLKEDWSRCRRVVNKDEITNDFWIDAIVDLKTQKQNANIQIPFKDIKNFEGTDPNLKSILKMALYLNRYQEFTQNLYAFNDSVFANPELREIISYMLFRDYEIVNAYKLIEDLNTSNAHNMKGNLNLLKGQNELALAEFKESFQLKRNSINALERLIPLSYLLEQDDYLLIVAESYQRFYPKDATSKVYQAAILIKKKEYQKARRIIRSTLAYDNNVPSEMMYNLIAYTDWKQGYYKESLKKYASACQAFERVSCWIYAMDTLWGHMFIKDKPIDTDMIKQDTSIIQAITQKDFSDKIEEKIYIDQRQIDELDDRLIQLAAE